MLVVRGYRNVPPAARGAVVAIGNFDGVHRGHQALLAEVRRLAGPDRPHGVVVFDPHPRRVFQSTVPLFELTPLALKLDLIARYGASVAVVLSFDGAMANLEASAFISNVLVEGLGVHHVVIGYDFHFGKGRAGSPDTLRAAGKADRFGVSVLEPVTTTAGPNTVVASSSAVRASLAAGSVDQAAAMLGHRWRIVGTVTGGAKRGTGMGYPTANVSLPTGCALAHGIYAARVYIDGAVHAGAAYLGTRPTFDNGRPVLETFLLDFDDDLYGRTIEVEFIARLRGDQAFTDMSALIAQMDRDVAATRAHLAAADALAWPPPA